MATIMSSKLVATILLLTSTLVVEGIKVYDFPNKQLKEAFSVFQATEGVPVQAEKTLQALKTLFIFYQEQHDQSDMIKFLELLKGGDLSITRCNQRGLKKISQLLEEWHSHINVKAYLQHYRQELIELCVPNFEDIQNRYQKLFNLNSVRYTKGEKILLKLRDLKLAMDKDPNNLLGLNRDKVNKFLDYSELNEEKCNGDALHSINSEILNLSDVELIHIKPYLKYIIKHLEMFCNKKGKYANGKRSLL